MALAGDLNISRKETEIYASMKTERLVSRMCKVRIKIVPIIIAAVRTIKKGLDQNLQLLSGYLSATELQKVEVHTTEHCTQYS
jgi:hypothetical protein